MRMPAQGMRSPQVNSAQRPNYQQMMSAMEAQRKQYEAMAKQIEQQQKALAAQAKSKKSQ